MDSFLSNEKPYSQTRKRDRRDDEDNLRSQSVKRRRSDTGIPFSCPVSPSVSEEPFKLHSAKVGCFSQAAPRQRTDTGIPFVLPISPSLYEGPFPFAWHPVEVGHFSLDAQRCYYGDDHQLRYYAPPSSSNPFPRFDLLDGYHDRYVPWNEGVREGLEKVLKWIAQNNKQLQDKEKRQPLSVDYVTLRGHLRKVLTTPYETREGWQLAVSLFCGTLYLSEIVPEAVQRQQKQCSERDKQQTYMGFKFEKYMCADTQNGAPDPSAVVNTHEAFCTVIQVQMGSHSLLFSAEVDCTDPLSPWPDPPGCYVELKTTRAMQSCAHRRNFYKYKMIKWWAQSFLSGVPQIVVGYRDDTDSIVELKTIKTADIPETVKKLIGEEQNCWKANVCMNFLMSFLDFVKKVVTTDDPKLVHLFEWEPEGPVSYTVHRDSEYTFLPEWYVKAIKRK